MKNLNIQPSEEKGQRENLFLVSTPTFSILSSFQPRFSLQGKREPDWLDAGHLPLVWQVMEGTGPRKLHALSEDLIPQRKIRMLFPKEAT